MANAKTETVPDELGLSVGKIKDSSTIVLVDDEKLARMVTRRRLERMGHRIIEAENGQQALEILQQEKGVDLIISDWMMPEMDGPTFCEAVKSREELRSIPIILMTALDQPDQIAEGLRRGADDFLTKAAADQEIIARVNAGLRTHSLIQKLAEKQEEINAELKSASLFVTSLLPKPGKAAAGVQLAWEFVPSLELGGDLFQVTPWSQEHLGLVILDMSGHGIGPALRAVSLAMEFRSDHMEKRHPTFDPGDIIQTLNRENPLTDDGEYFTIWVGCLHLPTRQLRYATAGHPGALLTREGQPGQRLESRSWPIGFGIEEVYKTQEITLKKGDRLHFFSDGIYEVFSKDGKLWDRDSFDRVCDQAHNKPLEAGLKWIVKESQKWQGQETFGDDVALVGIDIQS